MSALLHDPLEDTKITPEELEAEFGNKACEFVLDVTDDKTLPRDEQNIREIEHAKNISKGATLIKLDRMENIFQEIIKHGRAN